MRMSKHERKVMSGILARARRIKKSKNKKQAKVLKRVQGGGFRVH
jgi:hypothetical protein